MYIAAAFRIEYLYINGIISKIFLRRYYRFDSFYFIWKFVSILSKSTFSVEHLGED